MRQNISAVFLLCVVTALALGGCSSDKKKPLTGERIPVMQFQQADKADASVGQVAVELAPEKEDFDWSVPGGSLDHDPENIALNNGALKKFWSVDIGDGSTDSAKLITAPVAMGNQVFAADINGKVSAYDLQSGKKLWQTEVMPKHQTATVSPGLAVDGAKLYVTDGINHLLALDKTSGKILWTHDLGQSVRGAPTVQNNQVYIVTLGDETLALNADTGEQVWRHEGIQEAAGLLGAPSPAIKESVVMTTYSSGDIAALRAETGQEAWSDNLTGGMDGKARQVTQLSGFRGHPVIDEDVVLVGNASSRTVAIHIPTGERVWQKEFGLLGTPWISGNMIYTMTSNNELVGLIKRSGQIRWIASLPKFEDQDKEDPIFWSGPVLGGNRLIVVGSNREMQEIDPSTGKMIRKTELPGPAMITPIITQKTLIVVTDKGDMVAYR